MRGALLWLGSPHVVGLQRELAAVLVHGPGGNSGTGLFSLARGMPPSAHAWGGGQGRSLRGAVLHSCLAAAVPRRGAAPGSSGKGCLSAPTSVYGPGNGAGAGEGRCRAQIDLERHGWAGLGHALV